MNIYKLSSHENAQWAITQSSVDALISRELGPEPVHSTWKSIPVDVPTILDGEVTTFSDLPYFGRALLVFRPRAYDVLRPVLADLGEFLPLEFTGDTLQLFHCTNYIDALDEGRSVIRRFPSSGRIWEITSYRFRAELVQNQIVFRIPEYDFASPLLVTDHFRAIVEQHNLFGIKLLPIWSSDGSLVELYGSSKLHEIQLK